jgi:hypothetical protein
VYMRLLQCPVAAAACGTVGLLHMLHVAAGCKVAAANTQSSDARQQRERHKKHHPIAQGPHSSPGAAIAAVAPRGSALFVGDAPPRAQHVAGGHEGRVGRALCVQQEANSIAIALPQNTLALKASVGWRSTGQQQMASVQQRAHSSDKGSMSWCIQREHRKQLTGMYLTPALGGGVEAAAPAVRVVAVHAAVDGVALRGRRAARQGRVQGLGSRSSRSLDTGQG